MKNMTPQERLKEFEMAATRMKVMKISEKAAKPVGKGKGKGNYGHGGRPGKVGGSIPRKIMNVTANKRATAPQQADATPGVNAPAAKPTIQPTKVPNGRIPAGKLVARAAAAGALQGAYRGLSLSPLLIAGAAFGGIMGPAGVVTGMGTGAYVGAATGAMSGAKKAILAKMFNNKTAIADIVKGSAHAELKKKAVKLGKHARGIAIAYAASLVAGAVMERVVGGTFGREYKQAYDRMRQESQNAYENSRIMNANRRLPSGQEHIYDLRKHKIGGRIIWSKEARQLSDVLNEQTVAQYVADWFRAVEQLYQDLPVTVRELIKAKVPPENVEAYIKYTEDTLNDIFELLREPRGV